MAVRIPLPRYEKLPEGIYFHRRYKSDVYEFVLQVPDDSRVDSETFLLNLRDSMHKCWVEGLENSRNLLSMLQWAEHVAYCPRTGHFEEMPDLDEESPVAQKVALARTEAATDVATERVFAARRDTKAAALKWKPSKFRMALSGRGRRRWRR